jgi:hypothetical protein
MRCIVRPAVSRERAVELVRLEFEKRGWPFPGPRGQPVVVESGLLCHRVFLGPGLGETFVKVDKLDGTIRHIGIPPS